MHRIYTEIDIRTLEFCKLEHRNNIETDNKKQGFIKNKERGSNLKRGPVNTNCCSSSFTRHVDLIWLLVKCQLTVDHPD